MILFLCYVCPPLAVLLMGRPFSAVFNFFATCFLWAPGVGHALICYADYKSNQSVKQVTRAINHPAYVKEQRAQAPTARQRKMRRVDAAPVATYDSPSVGQFGTQFRHR